MLLPRVLEQVNTSGREGIQRTLHRHCADFHVPGDKALGQAFVGNCAVCQQNKTSHLLPANHLQPLPVPALNWKDIAMDFIEGLPRVNKTVILTMVDRLSKATHFIPLGHPCMVVSVARAVFDEIIRLHILPASIISARDLVFTGTLWHEQSFTRR